MVAKKDNKNVKSFEDIKGLKSAQSLTSNYRDIAEKNGAEIQGVEGLSQSIELIEQGRVDVTVNDKISVLDYLNKKKGANVKIVAEAAEASESAFMFRKGDDKLVKEVNKALEDMKEDGTYKKISEKWFGEDVSPSTSIYQDPQAMIDILQSSLLPLIKGALYYSIPLTLISFAVGMILAILTALARLSKYKVLQIIARIYVSAIRGTPLLVQLFIIFYGLPNLGIRFPAFLAAVIAFSLNKGAYSSEIIRAAIQSIPKGQWEAGSSIGMTYGQTLWRIILPQAARVSIPPLANSFISLVKDTSLASLILVTEMFRIAQQIAATNYEFLLIYMEAALLYWVMCFILSIIQGRIENRLDRYIAK